MPTPILVILTGGTIDAQPYTETPKNIIPLAASVIPDALLEMGMAECCTCMSWISKDSKDFTAEEIRQLAEIIRDSGFSKVLITHGTDRMPENARALLELREVLGLDVTVVFTGAMTPLSNQWQGISESDGFDNLRYAVERLPTAKAGVWIAFHRHLYNPRRTIKDFEKKIFIENM